MTEYDRGMDAASINPGEQVFSGLASELMLLNLWTLVNICMLLLPTFEKTISGMYLGEIVRRVAWEDFSLISSKQLAAGLINLGDMSYKTFSKYCNELVGMVSLRMQDLAIPMLWIMF